MIDVTNPNFMDDLADVGKQALCVGSIRDVTAPDSARINALLIEVEHLNKVIAERDELIERLRFTCRNRSI